MASMDDSLKTPRRRWLRFSLRSFLLAVTVLVLAMGWKFNRVWNQRLVVAEVQRLNGWSAYDDFRLRRNSRSSLNYTAPGPEWLRSILGQDIFSDVVYIGLYDPRVTDDTLALIARLPHLHELHIKSDNVTDAGVAHLARLSQLESLAIHSKKLTDAGLANLTGLKNLKALWYWGPIRVRDFWALRSFHGCGCSVLNQ
jgi:hypothetical protein